MVSSVEYGRCLSPCTAHGEATCSSSNSKTAVISACFWSENYDFILKRLKTPKYKRYRNIMLCYVIKNRLKRNVFKRKAFYNVRQLF